MTTPQETPVFQFKQLEKFVMYTNAPGVEGKRSSLHWSTYRGNPRISVFTGVPNDIGKGVINAAMNPETYLIFLDLFALPNHGTDTVREQPVPKTLNGRVWRQAVRAKAAHLLPQRRGKGHAPKVRGCAQAQGHNRTERDTHRPMDQQRGMGLRPKESTGPICGISDLEISKARGHRKRIRKG